MKRQTRLEKVRNLVEQIEKDNNTQELTELAVYLETFRQKLQVRSMDIVQQRLAVCSAALAKDKPTLRKFLHSQYEEIVSWARESLLPPGAAPPWPRVSV
jgi:hypothetical protein